MLTLYDYLPSQNAWKIRQLLAHLALPYTTVEVSIFEGAGRSPEILALNPTGKMPILVTEDGRALAESNAILAYLADGTPYLPAEPFARARVHQWLSFEQEQVEIGDRIASILDDDGQARPVDRTSSYPASARRRCAPWPCSIRSFPRGRSSQARAIRSPTSRYTLMPDMPMRRGWT